MSFKCRFCGKEFETQGSCKGHYGHCKVAKNILHTTLTKETLEDLMFNQNLSSNYIGNTWMFEHTGYRYGADVVIRLAKKYGLKPRTLQEANHNPTRRQLYIDTVKRRYGSEYTNISQIEFIKKKKEDTFFKHYGVRNIFCNNKYIVDKFEEKYGVRHNSQREDFVQNLNPGTRSHAHIRVENLLSELNVNFTSEVSGLFNKFNEHYLRNYCPRPDILIPEKKIVIEIQGDMWHANPNKYKENDIIDTWEGELTAKQIWERDRIRKEHIESFGYTVYYLWESEIQHNIGEVKCKIKKWLGL